jgi:hypothetical protein
MLKTFTKFDSAGKSLVHSFGAALMDHTPSDWNDTDLPFGRFTVGRRVKIVSIEHLSYGQIGTITGQTRPYPHQYVLCLSVTLECGRTTIAPLDGCELLDEKPEPRCISCGNPATVSTEDGPLCPKCEAEEKIADEAAPITGITAEPDDEEARELAEYVAAPLTPESRLALGLTDGHTSERELFCNPPADLAPLPFEPIISGPFRVGRRVRTKNRPGDLWIREQAGTIVERRDLGGRPAYCVLYDGENGGGRHEPDQLELLDEPDRAVTADADHEDGYTVAEPRVLTGDRYLDDAPGEPDEDHPNTVWNFGHIDGLGGLAPVILSRWSSENRIAYANGHRSGTLNRTTNERAEANRVKRHPARLEECFNAGQQASLEDAAPIPPASLDDDGKGAWLAGYGDADKIRIARNFDHVNEMADRQTELDAIEAGSNYGCW